MGEARWLAMKEERAVADRHVRADRDRSAARPADHVRGRDGGMEEPGPAGLSAAHTCPLPADRENLSPRHKYPAGRSWRKVKRGWGAWNTRSVAAEAIVRLILDGTVVRVRLDRKATSISLLVVLGVREDGQKVLLAIKSMGGESAEAWRTVLADLIDRGLRRPEFLIVVGARGLKKAIASVWDGVPVQRCTVHKH